MIEFGKVRDYQTEHQRINRLSLELRKIRPPMVTSWEEPADWLVKSENLGGDRVKAVNITLTPTGCEWASTGGCTMCGEYEGSTKSRLVSAEFHVAQFASAVGKYVFRHNPEWIRIYQEGNYLNPREVSTDAQLTILQLASLVKGVRRVTVECMAKMVNRAGAENLANAVAPGVQLEVGIGFEAENDVVRNICVNKGEEISHYERAIQILKARGIQTLAYVLLKPAFLSEGEGIEECVETVKKALGLGFDAVSIEPVSIHPYTLVHALHLKDLYQPPWLWSLVEVARRSPPSRDLRLGGVEYYPRPIGVAYNRHPDGTDGCNREFWTAIKSYNETRDLRELENLKCSCHADWEHTLEEVEKPLKERMALALSAVTIGEYISSSRKPDLDGSVALPDALSAVGGSQFVREQ